MPQAVEVRDYVGSQTHRASIIVVGVPTFGAVSIEWHGHMMQFHTPLNRVIRHLYVKGKEVGAARNEIVRSALEHVGPLGERVSHVLFIDDDVLVPSDALARLLAHNRPIVGGLYYAKTPSPQPLILGPEHTGVMTDWTPGDLVECEAHGMGLTLIAREVFEALEAPWFQTTHERLGDHDGAPVFRHQTEDVYFLERAKAKGYQPAVDTGCFAFHYAMNERVGYPLHLWKQATEGDGDVHHQRSSDPIVDAALHAGAVQQKDELERFATWVRSLEPAPQTAVEIGTHQGGTAYLLASLVSGLVVSVDLPNGVFSGLPREVCEARNAKLAAKFPHFRGVIGDSHDPVSLQAVRDTLMGRPVDLLFIDGDHSYDGVRQDFEMYAPLVRDGGWVVFHDINDTPAHRGAGCEVARLWQQLDGRKREFNVKGYSMGIGAIQMPARVRAEVSA